MKAGAAKVWLRMGIGKDGKETEELRQSRGWGGKRTGAGRKKKRKDKNGKFFARHDKRPELDSRHPVHVTLRSEVSSLRSAFLFPTVELAIQAVNRERERYFRIVVFSVQSNHMHMIVEATDRQALSRGVQALCRRIARELNRILFRTGRVFSDRFHQRALTTTLEVRRALIYTLENFRKHHTKEAQLGIAHDPYSSARYFDGYVNFNGNSNEAPAKNLRTQDSHSLEAGRAQKKARMEQAPVPTAPPQTWLLRTGWKIHGLLP